MKGIIRNFRRIQVLLLSIMLLFIFTKTTNVYAYYDYNVDGLSVEEASKDPKYWHQGTIPQCNGITLGNTRSTVGQAACGYFAASYLLVKMELMNPNNENPINLINWCNEDITHRTIGNNPGEYWHIKPSALPSKYPDKNLEAQYGTKESSSCSGLSGENLKTWVKGKMSEGYFVALCFVHDDGAHWVAVDGFDENDNMILADSAYKATTTPKKFEDSNSFGNYGSYYKRKVKYSMLFRLNGVDPLKSKSIYGGDFDIKVTEDEIVKYKALVEEWELKGMPCDSLLYADQSDIILVDNSYLTIQENTTLVEIKENIKLSKKHSFSIYSVITKFLGILLIVYSILLILAVLTDKTNSWVDISFVKIITLGRKELTDDVNVKDKSLLSVKQLFIRIIVIFILGVVLVSKVPLIFYSKLISIFSKL